MAPASNDTFMTIYAEMYRNLTRNREKRVVCLKLKARLFLCWEILFAFELEMSI